MRCSGSYTVRIGVSMTRGAEFEQIAKVQPKLAVGARTTRGHHHRAEGKQAEARRLRTDTRAGSARAGGCNNLAWMMPRMEAISTSLCSSRRPRRASLTDSAEVNDTLGWITTRRGSLPWPSSRCATALRRDKNAMYHFHLGLGT